MNSNKYEIGKAHPYQTSDGKTLWRFRARITVKTPHGKIANTRSRKGFATQALAEKAGKRELLPKWYEEEILKVKHGALWKSFCEEWIEALHKGQGLPAPVEPTTVHDHVSNLRLYTRDLDHRPIEEIEPLEIRSIMQQMEADGLSISRRKAVRSSIRAVFQWGLENRKFKILRTDPTMGIKFGKKTLESSKEKPVLSEREQLKLLAAARSQKHEYYWLWAFICLTGVRSGEAFACKWDDVDFEQNLLRIDESWNGRMKRLKSTKNGKWRKIPINEDLAGLLRELKALNHDPEFVLPRINSWQRGESAAVLQSFCNEIGIRPCTTHGLRASFTVNLLHKGAPTTTVMKVLGWTDIKTMTIYTRLSGIDVEGATDTIKLLPTLGCGKLPEDVNT